jgi:hypothetical protein
MCSHLSRQSRSAHKGLDVVIIFLFAALFTDSGFGEANVHLVWCVVTDLQRLPFSNRVPDRR